MNLTENQCRFLEIISNVSRQGCKWGCSSDGRALA